jgi:RHS repeat-associated protein
MQNSGYMTDALGSTLALTDATGTVNSQYSYEAYGNTTASGTTSDNAYQYTGRENDGTGLYYYRARYYDSQTSRFISQDPIGFGGGVNQFGYVGGDPVSFVDPSGNNPLIIGAVIGGIAGGVGAYNSNGGHVDGSVVAGVAVGAISGAASSIGLGFLGPVVGNFASVALGSASGGLGNAVGQIAGQMVNGKSYACSVVDRKQAAVQAGVGALSAVYGVASAIGAVAEVAPSLSAATSSAAGIWLNFLVPQSLGGLLP